MRKIKQINLELLLKNIHEELEKLNDEIHSENPPDVYYNEPIVIELINGWGRIEFRIKGESGKKVDWKAPLIKFHSRISIPELNKEPAGLDFHSPYDVHYNVCSTHIPHEQYNYDPYNSTAGSFAVGYPTGWNDYKEYLFKHFSGTTI